MQERHGGSINAVAFNADATICATGGEDRAICLWETTEGKRIGRVSGAHNAGVTSLVFTPKGQIISAGKDRRIILWNVVKDGDQQTLEQAGSFDRRSGEVQLAENVQGLDGLASKLAMQSKWTLDADFPVAKGGIGENLRLLRLLKGKVGITNSTEVFCGEFTIFLPEALA